MGTVRKYPSVFVLFTIFDIAAFPLFGWIIGLLGAGFIATTYVALRAMDKAYDALTPKVTKGEMSILAGFIRIAVPFYLTICGYMAIAAIIILKTR